MRRSLGNLIVAGFAGSVVALVLVSVVSYRSLRSLEQDTALRNLSSLALLSLGDLLVDLVDAETGQRGYIVTGEPAYQEPYREAKTRIGNDTIALRKLSRADTLLARALGRLGPLLTAKLAELDTTVALQRAGRTQAVRRIVLGGQGKDLMDRIRRELRVTRDAEQAERAIHAVRVVDGTRLTRQVIVWSGVLTTLLLVVSGFLIARELTARTRAEQAVAETERQLFQILEAMPVGVFVIDPAGRAYYGNKVGQDILGKVLVAGTGVGELSEMYGVYLAGTGTLCPPERLPIARALQGELVHTDDLEIHAPGGVRPVEVWAAPVKDSDGRLVFAVAAFSDITERKRVQAQIKALNAKLEYQVEELEEVNRELETFSYSVSHDLRAPLRAIDGFARMLEEDHGALLNADAGRLLGVITKNAQRMGRLIDDLLRFSRLSRQELEAAPIDMTALARGVADELTAADPGVRSLTVAPLPPALGDRALLRQVWANLIGNAIKYSGRRADACIEIGGSRNGADLEYFVRDNGVGFDMAYADKLFGVFQRLHGAEQFEGTGVGLAVVQRVILRHGGRVWAEGRHGDGATFFFSLPAVR